MTVELSARVPERNLEVDLSLEDGETLALLGPNGSGKSTVLAVVAGLLRPSTGRVVLGGHVLTDVGPGRAGTFLPPHARHTALLGQDALLFPHLDALENVAFGPRSRGIPRRDARLGAQRWLDEAGAGHLSRRRPGQLSGGQAQRVAVARALAAEPHLLLLDEPMAALDVAVQPALRQVLRKVLAGRSAIIVTHDPLDALLLADRVAVLEDGHVVERGESSVVLSRPRSAFAARLAGLNLITGTWGDDGALHSQGRLVFGRHDEDDDPLVAGEAGVAVFRPQAVAVYRDVPHGSPRNAFEVTVQEIEPRGDLIRIRGDGLAADVTVQAAAELELVAGAPAIFVVKATEVAVYAT